MNLTRQCSKAQRQSGMTLIEVLVTLVIVSVGLLGTAALQLVSLRNNYDAYVRSQAAVLAGDILDRMRVNRGAALFNQYTTAVNDAAPTGTSPAEVDVAQWKSTLATQLPNGAGGVSNVDPVARTVTVTIQWNERPTQDMTSDGTMTFTTRSRI